MCCLVIPCPARSEIYTLSLHDALPIFTLESIFRYGDFGYEINETMADKYDKLYDRLDQNPDLKFPNLSEMLPLPAHPEQGLYNPVTEENEK